MHLAGHFRLMVEDWKWSLRMELKLCVCLCTRVWFARVCVVRQPACNRNLRLAFSFWKRNFRFHVPSLAPWLATKCHSPLFLKQTKPVESSISCYLKWLIALRRSPHNPLKCIIHTTRTDTPLVIQNLMEKYQRKSTTWLDNHSRWLLKGYGGIIEGCGRSCGRNR